ncbi:MAG: RrF2 family transcriptional regulator [Thermoguttaceae bacterium]
MFDEGPVCQARQKIIHVLARRGIVLTQRGVGGGVSLARAPQEVTILELCEALEDPVLEPRCMLGNAECTEDRACPAHQFCQSHRKELDDFLRRTTLADIAAFETRRRWRASARQKQLSGGGGN